MGRNSDLAEDITQDTFIRAFGSLREFKITKYSYLTYLLTIAHNLLINFYRQKQTQPLEDAELIPVEITQNIQQKIDLEIVWACVQKLQTKEKNVILMMYREDISIRDVSLLLDKTENAIKLILSRARKKLRQKQQIKDAAKYLS